MVQHDILGCLATFLEECSNWNPYFIYLFQDENETAAVKTSKEEVVPVEEAVPVEYSSEETELLTAIAANDLTRAKAAYKMYVNCWMLTVYTSDRFVWFFLRSYY